jgi:hypothetical protein
MSTFSIAVKTIFTIAALMLLTLSSTVQAANTTYRNAILADNPLAYWELDETSGTNAADSSGNGFDGTYTAPYTLGQASAYANLNTAVDFGESGLVTLADNLGNHSQVTVEAWIKMDARQGFIYDSGDFALGVNGAGEIVHHMDANGPPDSTTFPPLVVDTWYYLAATYDADVADATFFYLDGVLQTTEDAHENGLDAILGVGTLGDEFDGLIDEVAIYDSVLSPAQIAAHYAAASAIAPTAGVPEPSTLLLAGLGLCGLLMRRRRR